MGKVISKFLVEMYNGRPTIKMLDRSSSQTESVVVIESDSLEDNVKQILSMSAGDSMRDMRRFGTESIGDMWM